MCSVYYREFLDDSYGEGFYKFKVRMHSFVFVVVGNDIKLADEFGNRLFYVAEISGDSFSYVSWLVTLAFLCYFFCVDSLIDCCVVK